MDCLSKIIEFPKLCESIFHEAVGVRISPTVTSDDMDCAYYALSVSASGLENASKITPEAILHGALVVAAQSALAAGYSQKNFEDLCKSIKFISETPPEKAC